MKIYSTYSVKIKKYNRIFSETVTIYRNAVQFFIEVCLFEWVKITAIQSNQAQMMYVESLCHKTKKNPSSKYDFDSKFYKMPSYIRRAAIAEAIGKVSSYQSNLKNWQENPVGKKPTLNRCGCIYPSLYRNGMYHQIEEYTAQIKIYHNNTWTWFDIDLCKSDMDYIKRKCNNRKMCTPTLQKRGKEWFLDCDLNASYNIAARYYIREHIKSCSVTERLDLEAKVPQWTKRSTCTLADLIRLNAVLNNVTVV